MPDWNPAAPAGFVRYRGQVDSEISSRAMSALAEPFGAWVPFVHSDGRQMGVLLERHYHEPGGPLRPWGPHKGASVFVRS